MAIEIVALHMLGDYILQTETMAQKKLTVWWVRLGHVLTYTMPFVFWGGWFYGEAGIWFSVCVGVTHFLIDSYRFAPNHPWPPKSILIDQSLHLISLAVLARVFLGAL
jgi:hypothetical protein